jgi:predicted naringenin-chalcone synthase
MDYRLVTELGLSHATERYHVGFMGCYAAFPALRMAHQFCLAQPDAVVLVVCLELCSLHLQIRPNPDTILANALFSDGAAAAIVSARPPSGRRPSFALQQFFSALAPEGSNDMAWEIGNSGFNIVLSSYVPDIIEANVGKIVDDLLARGDRSLNDIDLWALHPGGKSILDKIERTLALRPDQLVASRETLRDYGNMSSATVLFVLKRLLGDASPTTRQICAMAFGPGLVIETGLMERVPARQTEHASLVESAYAVS